MEKTLTYLRVSEIIGCKRALFYKSKNYDKLPNHPLAKEGTELHEAIELYLRNGNMMNLKYPDNEHAFNNFLKFFVGYPYKELTHSNEIRLYAKNYYPHISGKYDFILDKCMIDFKRAKFYRAKFDLQLSGYSFLSRQVNLDIKNFAVLLLGNYKPELVFASINEEKFLKEYNKAVEVINAEYKPLPEWDYGCQFCEYIHHCRTEV